MADDVRETIRAAQAAELRGDTDGAIALLQQAASQYRASGKRRRALQMLRQALRLDPSRTDVADHLRQLESLPEGPVAPAPAASQGMEGAEGLRLVRDSELLTAQMLEALSLATMDETLDATALERALESAATLLPDPEHPEQGDAAPEREPGEAAARGRGRRMLERGPTRADPALEAWCSFCCRPRTEVGEVVAGPAGAFICASCTRESTGLLGDVPRAPAAATSEAPARAVLGLVGQDAARALLERALAQPAPRILLLGPEGSGKSTWLRALVSEGRAVSAEATSRLVPPPPGRVLVLEDVERLAPAEQAALAGWLESTPGAGVLLSARAEPPKPVLTLRDGALRLAVYSAEALVEATGGALEARLARCVGPVVCLTPPDAPLLAQVARARLALQPGVEVPDAALEALARAARGSGHALAALLARLTPGTWTVDSVKGPPAPASRPRRGKRKA